MLEAVSWFVMLVMTHILDCYVFSKIINKKFKLTFKAILIIIIFSLFVSIIGINNLFTLKFVITNIVTITIFKLVYHISIVKALVGAIFTYLGYAICEIIFSIIFIFGFKIEPEIFTNNYLALIFANIFEFIVYIFIFNIKIVTKRISKVLDWCDNNRIINMIINIVLIMLLIYMIIYNIVYSEEIQNIGILYLLISLCIIIFVIGYFNEKSNNNKLTIEYGQLLEYVKDYEKEVVEKGKRQHEYKNQLIVINDMIPKTNKKLKKYVEDKLEVEKNIKDNVWLEKLTNLPSGGIKGLVYYKLKQMIEKNIDVYIEVDNELSNKKKWFNIEKNLEDYTRILGVYLDNAIEAANESKDKQIIIEFKENNDSIEFILSNTYVGKINYDSIDKEKFSTKGKGRGYGLSLAKDIIDNNKLLNQKREINGKFYVQKLTIKK